MKRLNCFSGLAVSLFAFMLISAGILLNSCKKGNKSNSDEQQSQSALNITVTSQYGVDTIQLVEVAGGTFTMGCDGVRDGGDECYEREKPVHQVTLSDFKIGKYEVTQKLWHVVMGSLPSQLTSDYGIGDNYPVYYVSRNDIVNDFLPALNRLTGKKFRLPREAEWEYAARGGNNGNNKYSGSNTIGDVAWYTSNSGGTNHIVGEKNPNELGIYDMSGNVWEWCSDWYGVYSSVAQTNPTGASSGTSRILRGGSNNALEQSCRLAHRSYDIPGNRYVYNGFRLVLPAP